MPRHTINRAHLSTIEWFSRKTRSKRCPDEDMGIGAAYYEYKGWYYPALVVKDVGVVILPEHYAYAWRAFDRSFNLCAQGKAGEFFLRISRKGGLNTFTLSLTPQRWAESYLDHYVGELRRGQSLVDRIEHLDKMFSGQVPGDKYFNNFAPHLGRARLLDFITLNVHPKRLSVVSQRFGEQSFELISAWVARRMLLLPFPRIETSPALLGCLSSYVSFRIGGGRDNSNMIHRVLRAKSLGYSLSLIESRYGRSVALIICADLPDLSVLLRFCLDAHFLFYIRNVIYNNDEALFRDYLKWLAALLKPHLVRTTE